MKSATGKRVFFSYFKPLTYSGQSGASELIIKELRKRGWDCRVIPVYPLERGVGNHLIIYLRFIAGQIATLFGFLRLSIISGPLLHLNLGQGIGSFLRFGIPYFPIRLLKPSLKVVISLHGSIFMRWNETQLVTRVFLYFLRTAEVVTVLGDNQRQHLVKLGVDEEKIVVLPNTCEIEICGERQVLEKHKTPDVINVLHLSLLIESKGFPVYLEALEQLSSQELEKSINATLCGPMAFTSYCTELNTAEKKERWITDKIGTINETGKGAVKLKWIPGAEGEEKRLLFENTHIFVFPSCFPVEAQPLVLLEAMSSGCALLTSDVGEIASTLSEVDADILTEISPSIIATELKKLIDDEQLRLQMALSGRDAMLNHFTIKKYGDRWEDIFIRVRELESYL